MRHEISKHLPEVLKLFRKYQKTGAKAAWLPVVALLLCATGSAAQEAHGPVALLEGLTQQLIDIAERHPEYLDDPAALRRVAGEFVLPHVDFTLLARQVLGKHWRSANAQQRAAFEAEFRELLLGTYLRSVSAYKENTIRYLPLRESRPQGQVMVHALIERNKGRPVQVSFRMHQAGDQWLIFDVVVGGISLITTHRSSFSQLIRNHGIDGVLEQLKAKNLANAAADRAGR